MRKWYTVLITCFLLIFIGGGTFAQQTLVADTNKKQLNDLAVQLNALFNISHQKAISLAKSYGWAIRRKTKNGGIISLQGLNSLGFPVYLTTFNLESAETTNTTAIQPGGSSGLSLTGSSSFLENKLAIWDAGSVYTLHQEFAGKTITLKDDTSAVMDHSTHVAGTMIAHGVVPDARGMAYNATTLASYNFDNDVAKMSAAAANLLLSNHSYGDEAGWDFNEDAGRWEWYGVPGDTVDYSFGIYDTRTQAWDKIANKAPYYLIVESAGNAHALGGPPVGTDYYGYKSRTDQTLVDKGPRPANISSNQDYTTTATTANAKNILTVSAVASLPDGPMSSSAINVAGFDSWGPTNDGRIKPDIMGMGISVLSTGSESPQSYIVFSGTSMSAPNVTGSLYLLQEYYAQQNEGKFMRAATLKGLVCHTAYDAGNPGPDYIYGWGLLNTKAAAQAITDNGTKSLVKETTLQQSQRQTFSVTAAGNAPLSATISWNDPAGAASSDGEPDATIKLLNDLDIRVSDGVTTYEPWILDPAHPNAPATTGDNIRDNIEQVYIPSATAGKTYTITISNKGNLQAGVQDYGLIVTGISAVNTTPVNTGNDINLAVYPVPANNNINVAFNINTGKPLDLSLVNSAGRTFYSNKRTLNAGTFSVAVDVSDYPPGNYVVRMLLGGKLYARKVIITR